MWQAEHVASLLSNLDPAVQVELVKIATEGDRNRSESLASFGGVGVFTREIQQAVLDSRADIAVHSLKDLPTQPVAGLQLAGVPTRGARYDALVLPAGAGAGDLSSLPARAKVGTGSPRRQAQLRYLRPDLDLLEVRGNVETRLKKLDAGEYDAIVLAQAGLERLNLGERCTAILAPPQMYPAVGQAALGLECRTDDDITAELLAAISDKTTFAEVTAERACLSQLRAGCHAPVGVWSVAHTLDATTIQCRLLGIVLSLDGTVRVQGQAEGAVSLASLAEISPTATGVGGALANKLISAGADQILGG